jgi:hypothetical protein
MVRQALVLLQVVKLVFLLAQPVKKLVITT